MNEPWILAVISALPPTFAALVSIWVSLRNGRAIVGVHKDINSRMDQALTLKGLASHAEGMLEEKIAAAAIAKAGNI